MIETSLAFGASQPQAQEPSPIAWNKAGTTVARRHAAMRYDVNERTAGPMPVFGQLLEKNAVTLMQADGPTANALADPAHDPNARPDIAYETLPEEDGYSFGDVIDMINPLQHLPVVGMLYRKFTGDAIKPFASIIGGTIFGGPVGAVSSTVNAIVKDRTGKDVGENALSIVGIDMTPAKRAKEDLVYLAPKMEETLSPAKLAAANLSYTKAGQRNFAAFAVPTSQRWNV
jgi:hypothetical protein